SICQITPHLCAVPGRMPTFTGFQRATVNLKQGTGAVAERRKTQARYLVSGRQAQGIMVITPSLPFEDGKTLY
ncbi:hypothetical protein, partial [Pantoea ananatis]